MFFLKNQDILQRVENFQKIGAEFQFKATNNRMYITGDMGEYMTSSDKIPARELVYIGMVKKYILKNNLQNTIPKIKTKVDYFKFSKSLPSQNEYSNCYEIDLKSAYWKIANDLGLLRPDLYKKASTINPKTKLPYMSKITRLAAIGSLARKYRVYTFTADGKMTKRRWRSRETEHIWDYICYKTAKVMDKAIKVAGNDFMFFWVDGIFVKNKKSRDAVVKAFKQEGFGSTVYKVEKVKVDEKIWAYSSEHKKKERGFPYPKDKK